MAPRTDEPRQKLLARTRRLRGQIESIERGLDAGGDYAALLQTVVAARGALDALAAELVGEQLDSALGSTSRSASVKQSVAETRRALRQLFR